MNYYAHSPKPERNIPAQTYAAHVNEVARRAMVFAGELAPYAEVDREVFLASIKRAATFHDLGKLDPENQKVLSGQKKAKSLPVQHTDAGAAYWLDDSHTSPFAAVAIQAHHIGYPDFIDEKIKQERAFRDTDFCEHTDKTLNSLIAAHQSAVADNVYDACGELKGDSQVFLRLLLSCLADADHTDTAVHYGEYPETESHIELRPAERLKKLDEYVAALGKDEDARSQLRREMYQACRAAATDSRVNSCDSPVGSGKTTAIMAHLLRQAERRGLRRIIVVLPFTNIITQSAATYRKALCLAGEKPNEVVAELHHRADFENEDARHLTALWRAPIIVTTAVAFFETLASNHPATLRRLHELPGSAIFVDESHAALPAKLLPMAWKWVNIYANEWSCYWILASGSLTRFWDIEEIAENAGTDKNPIPEIVDDELRRRLSKYEISRISYESDLTPKKLEELAPWIVEKPGPRLVIMNTVQSAATLADYFAKQYGREKVEHLSTALTPIDREKTLIQVKKRLKQNLDTDWTFIATSCVEAGVDLSFKTGFREIGSLVSLLQAAGRVNREGADDNAEMWSFKIAEGGLLKTHPGLKDAAEILQKYFENKTAITPDLSTKSIADEIRLGGTDKPFKKIIAEENCRQFPLVEKDFKVINTDTRITVVDTDLADKIKRHQHKIDWRDLQKNSVQIWKYKLEKYRCEEVLPGIYQWALAYDDFLGYMAGVLTVDKFISGEDGFII